MWVLRTWLKLLEVLSLQFIWVDLDGLAWWLDLSIVEVLKADDGPFLGNLMADTIEDIFDQSEVVDVTTTNIQISKLSPVCTLGHSPELLDTHQVWTVLGVESDRYVVGLAPRHDVIMAMDACIVQVDAPFVTSW